MRTKLIIGGLFLLSGGVFIGLQSGDFVSTGEVQNVVFEDVDPTVKRDNVGFSTTTDEFGNVIRIGVLIPISYETLVPTATGYIVEEVDEEIVMNLDSYNKCRDEGNLKNRCIQELKDDIKQTVDAYEQNLRRDIEELTRSDFRNEIKNTDL